MPQSNRQLHLNLFIFGVGQAEAAWRHPLTNERDLLDVAHYQNLARIAERGKLDSVFFADALAVDSRIKHNALWIFEPVTLLSAIAVATERIGLIATATTSYSDPYTTARKFASLDHISGGRAGWNIVTSALPEEAANFGLDDTPQHGGRYERATEFVDATLELWDSWEDDAVLLDAE
ncbi:LLM class flavin-dependent oxidoreductase, partial [Aldersonia kunmingensis]|uniref:LLM class flavin-dependent oxidoreductase n=1 Tax=Aldersonia kunmingensis TaxID=408066 RepID=UPI000A560BF4